MHADIAEKRQDLIALCRRFGVEREALEASRNYIRRRRILAEVETVYG
jgi:hypothetical protein